MRRFYKGQNILAVSDDMANNILRMGIKPKSIQCIYNIYDFAQIRKKAQEYEVAEQDYIICVGRLSLEKRLNILVDAYERSNIEQKLIF